MQEWWTYDDRMVVVSPALPLRPRLALTTMTLLLGLDMMLCKHDAETFSRHNGRLTLEYLASQEVLAECLNVHDRVDSLRMRRIPLSVSRYLFFHLVRWRKWS